MRLLPLPEQGMIRLRLERDEAQLLDQLVAQLVALLQSHSGTELDPDPLFAELEVGGSEHKPDDPALARLFPDAFEEADDASNFRRLTEQGLLNRKLHDALQVTSDLGLGIDSPDADVIEAEVGATNLDAWVRTLTALRLAIAARIGLQFEADHARLAADEETRGTVMVYDWLAAILDSLLQLLGSGKAPHAQAP